jgi:hypothetical protein
LKKEHPKNYDRCRTTHGYVGSTTTAMTEITKDSSSIEGSLTVASAALSAFAVIATSVFAIV